MKKCPVCERGKLKKGEIDEEMFGVALGKFEAELCDYCHESFVDERVMAKIEEKAKKIGIWGLAEKLKVAKSGNSLVVRLPARIAKFLSIKAGQEVLVHPESKEKLVIEIS
ncbi:MAG: AbrB/MazE/SpoVT family DNA-binding domain-containing protein [Candidatus Thermoplasmatota archaeon]